VGGKGPRGRRTGDPTADDGDIELSRVRAAHAGKCRWSAELWQFGYLVPASVGNQHVRDEAIPLEPVR